MRKAGIEATDLVLELMYGTFTAIFPQLDANAVSSQNKRDTPKQSSTMYTMLAVLYMVYEIGNKHPWPLTYFRKITVTT